MSPPNLSQTVLKSSRRRFLKLSTAAAGTALAAGIPVAAVERTAAQPPQPGKAMRSKSQNILAAGARGCPPEVRAALSGPWPSIRTPFTRQGDIDFDALHGHLDFLLQAKAKAVVLTWGDSLFSILTDDEIAQVTKAVARHVDGRAFVVAADGSWWTGKVVDFSKYCTNVGVDMLMVMPPDWAASTTVDSLTAHYRAVAEHIPVMLVTNYLGRRGMDFGLELCERLHREVPGVMALKDDVCGEFICKVCSMTHDRWALSAGGQKQNHLLMLPYGVDGYLSTFINFKPEIAWRYWDAIEAGDLPAASAVVCDYDRPLFDYIIKSEGSFDAAIHGIYELCGLAQRYRRPPYHTLTDKQMDDLAVFLQELNITC